MHYTRDKNQPQVLAEKLVTSVFNATDAFRLHALGELFREYVQELPLALVLFERELGVRVADAADSTASGTTSTSITIQGGIAQCYASMGNVMKVWPLTPILSCSSHISWFVRWFQLVSGPRCVLSASIVNHCGN